MAAPMSRDQGRAMTRQVVVAGISDGALACLPALLRAARTDWVVREQRSFVSGSPATILVHLPSHAADVISAAEAFAALDCPPNAAGDDRLVLAIAHAAAASDWPGQEDGARLAAFTRHAALAWAPRGIRVNLLSIGQMQPVTGQMQPVTEDAAGQAGWASDVARMVAHMQGWRSMTGQTLRLATA